MERVAFLIEPDDQRISCMLNPETIVIKRSAGIEERQSIGGNISGNNSSNSPVFFTGGGVTTIEMELLFDVTIPGSSIISQDVRDFTGLFFSLSENTIDNGGCYRPNIVRMVWGKTWNIPGVITDISERLDYFTSGGVPRRSWLKLRFRRIDEKTEFQEFLETLVEILDTSEEILETLDASSPFADRDTLDVLEQTSKTSILNDRIDSIAENFYKDPSLWRLIALFNGIIDPSENIVQRVIQIPPLKELVKLI